MSLPLSLLFLLSCLSLLQKICAAPSCGLLVARETGRESGEFEKRVLCVCVVREKQGKNREEKENQ